MAAFLLAKLVFICMTNWRKKYQKLRRKIQFFSIIWPCTGFSEHKVFYIVNWRASLLYSVPIIRLSFSATYEEKCLALLISALFLLIVEFNNSKVLIVWRNQIKNSNFQNFCSRFIWPFLIYAAEISVCWQLWLSQVLFQNNKWKFDVFCRLLHYTHIHTRIWVAYRGRILGQNPDKSRKRFPPCYSQSPLPSTALPWDFYFFKLTQPLKVSRVQLHCKGERRKTW